MKSLFLATALLISTSAMAELAKYNGKSDLVYNGKNDCSVTFDLDSQRKIQAIDYSGPTTSWEIIAENSNGYGPRKAVEYTSSDELLSDPKTFGNMDFKKSNNFFSEGFTLKATSSADGHIKGKFEIEISKKNDKTTAVSIKTNFKIALIPVASKAFECHDLVKEKSRN